MTLRAGLIGAGHIARFHVAALRRLPGVEIVGIMDRDFDRATRFAKEMRIATYSSLQALRDAGAQVIHVLTPPTAHTDVALDALALGCDVFVEKPLATSAEDCERIDRAAREHGRQVCVGHSLLYDPFIRRALDLVADGAIGDVLTFDYQRCLDQQSYPASGPTTEHQRGGYPFRDIGIHALYLAEAFIGPILDLGSWPMATGRGNCNLWVDEWRVFARSERGTAQIRLSWNGRPQQHLLIIQGTRGVIRVDLFGLSVTVRKARPLPEHASRVVNAINEGAHMAAQAAVNVGRIATGRIRQFHGVQALVAEFYSRLADGRGTPVPPASAARVVFWAEQVARQGDTMKDAWVASLSPERTVATTLVTGASGYIGQALVRRLLQQGTAVRLLVRRPPAADLATHPLVELVIGDLADAAAVNRAVEGIDTVYHLGAALRGSVQDFDLGTVTGTRNMVDGCERHGVRRLVYTSSLAVIDTDAGADGQPIVEGSTLERRASERGHYTRTKLEAEAIVVEAAKANRLRVVILRPGEVVGPDKPLFTSGVAQRLGKTLIVLGNGRGRLPLVHVSDVVDALTSAAAADVPNGCVLHLVEDTSVTRNDVIAHYLSTTSERFRVVRVPLPIVMLAARAAEMLGTRLLGKSPIGPRRIRAATASRTFDCTRAERLLRWKARHGVAAAFGASATHGHEDAAVFARANADQAATP